MKGQPNFLFLFSDQHRGDWMPYSDEVKARQGVSDLELHMPNIEGMMERGTTFTRAISPSPLCAPARACLASGMRYKKCRVYSNGVNYDYRLNTFYNDLHNSGYYVCGLGKFDLNKADLYWGDGYHELLQKLGFDYAQDNEGKMDAISAAELGIPGPYARELQENGLLETHVADMATRKNKTEPTPIPDKYYTDNWVTARGIEMLKNAPKDKPWFIQVNFSGPHEPWDITEEMHKNIQSRQFPDAVDCEFAKDNRPVRQNYAAMIENIDRNIGLLINAVKEKGDLDNTIIVYSADHGEMLGDHNKYGKQLPFEGSIHIPMVIDASNFKGAKAQYVHAPVELQDLAATFLEYADLPCDKGSESVSLKSVLSGDIDKSRDYGVSELIKPNDKGLAKTFGTACDGTYKLIMRGSEASALYNLLADPFECNDIASDHADIVERLTSAFGDRD